MTTMYDSVDATAIPRNAEIVAGYIDGDYKWSQQDWSLFPNAKHVRIAVHLDTNDGDVLDVEPGNSTPEQMPQWLQMRRSSDNRTFTVYTMRSWWQRCRDACRDAGIEHPHFWIAEWDNNPTIPDGVVAKQYQNPDLSGGHFDVSSTIDTWPDFDNRVGGGSIPPANVDVHYTVKSGDTLSEIGQRYGIPWRRIQNVNGIENPHLIYPGQRLIIPNGATKNHRNYTVKRGDTLSEIGQRHNISWHDIAEVNNIENPHLIYPGQKLVIP